MNDVLSRQFCRVFIIGVFIFLGCTENAKTVRANLAAGSVESAGANTAAESVETVRANLAMGSAEAAGSESRRELSYRAETEAHTLFMTIYDGNGVKRLLSSKHPAVLTSGLYFVFPDGVRDYEFCRNDGMWKRSGAQIYLFPQREHGEGLCVRFRARGSDGRMRYSRSFVLTGSG